MQFSLLLAAMASVATTAAAAAAGNQHNACPKNSCNNAITGGGRSGLPASGVRKADCSSYLLTVVTPSPSIVTTYIGDNSFYYNTAVTTAVTSTATQKPAYATDCAAAVDYASACRCWGITSKVTTVAQPTVTVTKTHGCQA